VSLVIDIVVMMTIESLVISVHYLIAEALCTTWTYHMMTLMSKEM